MWPNGSAADLTEAQKRQLFDEHVEWYRMYGMSMRPVPASWEEFQVYWDHMCRNVLENNWAARAVLDLTELPKPPFAQWIPDPLWAAQRKLLAPFFVWLTVGLYDPPVRELMGYQLVAPRRVAAPALRRPRPWRFRTACQADSASTLGPGPAWTAPAGGSRSIRHWCRPRRATCRPKTSAATPSITARWSPEPPKRRSRYAWG